MPNHQGNNVQNKVTRRNTSACYGVRLCADVDCNSCKHALCRLAGLHMSKDFYCLIDLMVTFDTLPVHVQLKGWLSSSFYHE